MSTTTTRTPTPPPPLYDDNGYPLRDDVMVVDYPDGSRQVLDFSTLKKGDGTRIITTKLTKLDPSFRPAKLKKGRNTMATTTRTRTTSSKPKSVETAPPAPDTTNLEPVTEKDPTLPYVCPFCFAYNTRVALNMRQHIIAAHFPGSESTAPSAPASFTPEEVIVHATARGYEVKVTSVCTWISAPAHDILPGYTWSGKRQAWYRKLDS